MNSGSASITDDMVCIGVIVGAHGVRGVVKVKSFTAEPEDLGAYGPLTDEAGSRVFAFEILGMMKGSVLCRLQGVEDRSAVELLKGQRLYVPREALPAPDDENEFYHSDLIGLPVFFPDGTPVGTVAALFDFGAGDVMEIRGEQGGSAMIPFTRDSVPVVDVRGKRVVAVPQPDLLEGPVAPAQRPAPSAQRKSRSGPIRPSESGTHTDEWPDEDWH